jgi:hypothetical protein
VQELGADFNQLDPYYGEETALLIVAMYGFPDLVQVLVTDLGADINQGDQFGSTPLIVAALRGHLACVRCLVQLGAEVRAANIYGNTALLLSVDNGHYPTTQYLLEEAGANLDNVNNNEKSVWDLLIEYLKEHDNDGDGEEGDESEVEADLRELADDLLRLMVLRGAPPPALVALLLPKHARLVQEGARMRARLPAYLAHRRAYLDLRCPRISLLPAWCAEGPDLYFRGARHHRGALGHGARHGPIRREGFLQTLDCSVGMHMATSIAVGLATVMCSRTGGLPWRRPVQYLSTW